MKVNGASVKAIRAARGRSLRDVAGAAELDAGYLSRVENGEKGAAEGTIVRLANALEVPVSAISYPDQPVLQATPETVGQIVESLAALIGVAR